MHAKPLQPMIPIERYRNIVGALTQEHDSWGDGFWLRFAAQAAVLSPDEPTIIASRIRAAAAALHDQAEWYQSLLMPMRFVVASLLVQHNIQVAEFLSDCRRTGDLLHQVGLRHGGFYEIMAVLILRLSPARHPLSMLEAERLKAIYDQMKKFHWWLTGPDDLPACAALAQCPGTAETVVARAEDAYQELHADGYSIGDHLQTAANLLPLTGLDSDAAVHRYLSVSRGIELRSGRLDPDHYDAVAILSLLDHKPELVVERLYAVNNELDLCQPDLKGAANFLIAADLTFLDLVRFDRDMRPITGSAAMGEMLRSLHSFHIASAVLISQLNADPMPVDLAPMGWPYGYV